MNLKELSETNSSSFGVDIFFTKFSKEPRSLNKSCYVLNLTVDNELYWLCGKEKWLERNYGVTLLNEANSKIIINRRNRD